MLQKWEQKEGAPGTFVFMNPMRCAAAACWVLNSNAWIPQAPWHAERALCS